MKRCLRCNIEKPLKDFYVHQQMKDGHLNYCKECVKSRVLKYYITANTKIKEYEIKRQKDPKRKASKLAYQKRYRLLNPEKSRARNLVATAVKNNKLVKKPCEVCGSLLSEAHHYDYSKPLDVRWLCRYHHRREENRLVVFR